MATLTVAVPKSLRGLLWPAGLALALVLGATLHLAWPRDMEYKDDEAWTFAQTQTVGRTAPVPWLGMSSSADLLNPGMSLWVFLFLGKVFAVHDPVDLARAVQILSMAAVVMLVVFALRCVPKEEREPWLWTAALLSVNPLAVLVHRKIWPPSVFPIFISCLLICWWYRRRPGHAFCWGLIGACLGQIHMPGFFFAAGFALWAFFFDHRGVAWRSWFVGSCLGALPLLPWLHYLLTQGLHPPVRHSSWSHMLEGKFWLRWVIDPLGLGYQYALEDDYGDFLSGPFFGGRPTYLVAFLHVAVLAVGVSIYARAGCRFWQTCRAGRGRGLGKQSPTALTQNAALWGYGMLLTISSMPIYRHYLVIAFPLEILWLARLALVNGGSLKVGRALLGTLCVAQVLLSASLLRYIHVNQVVHGDYGTAYGACARPAVPARTKPQRDAEQGREKRNRGG